MIAGREVVMASRAEVMAGRAGMMAGREVVMVDYERLIGVWREWWGDESRVGVMAGRTGAEDEGMIIERSSLPTEAPCWRTTAATGRTWSLASPGKGVLLALGILLSLGVLLALGALPTTVEIAPPEMRVAGLHTPSEAKEQRTPASAPHHLHYSFPPQDRIHSETCLHA